MRAIVELSEAAHTIRRRTNRQRLPPVRYNVLWKVPCMADHLTPEERSAQMRRVRSRDTKPEMRVRRVAHSLGTRFRLHRRDLPGTPDLVFPARRKIIQVHGCFWHRHEGCRSARMPTDRSDYWNAKLNRNVERDIANLLALKELSWDVLVVWECETGNLETLRRRLASFLLKPVSSNDQAVG